MPTAESKDFVFTFQSKGQKSTLTVPVVIPLEQSAGDFAGRLVQAHNLPCYVEDELKKSLQKFIIKETEKWYNENGTDALNRLKTGQVNVDLLASSWTKAYNQEVEAFSEPEEATDELVFSEVYHTMIHSPALEQMLKLEHSYSIDVSDLLRQRGRDLAHLEKRQASELDEALKNMGKTCTDEQVNQLTQKHIENTQMIESRWDSQLTNLQETQRREYKEWLMKVNEDIQMHSGTPTYMQRQRSVSSGFSDDIQQTVSSRMEESFTIHLGAQLKTTHNLRLLSCDILDLCRHQATKLGGHPPPQRIQTAMSLYSNSLNGMILLVDNRLNAYTGIKKDFAAVCHQSTDFHFPDLERQFAIIEQNVTKANEYRQQRKLAEECDKISVKSSGSSSSENQREDRGNRMYTGDFYITRHSNLAEVHVMFHLVSDEGLRNTDVSSRHPVILAIRNILKNCFRHDITTITIPLLLTHEMSEEMTIPWCMKRAELVFKCVKGFIMEMSSLCNSESKTIQFHVPKDLSADIFTQFSSMMPSIFRLSNPIVGK